MEAFYYKDMAATLPPLLQHSCGIFALIICKKKNITDQKITFLKYTPKDFGHAGIFAAFY